MIKKKPKIVNKQKCIYIILFILNNLHAIKNWIPAQTGKNPFSNSSGSVRPK